MTDEQLERIRDIIKQISKENDISIGLIAFEPVGYTVLVYGCPACLRNVMTDWVNDNRTEIHDHKYEKDVH